MGFFDLFRRKKKNKEAEAVLPEVSPVTECEEPRTETESESTEPAAEKVEAGNPPQTEEMTELTTETAEKPETETDPEREPAEEPAAAEEPEAEKEPDKETAEEAAAEEGPAEEPETEKEPDKETAEEAAAEEGPAAEPETEKEPDKETAEEAAAEEGPAEEPETEKEPDNTTEDPAEDIEEGTAAPVQAEAAPEGIGAEGTEGRDEFDESAESLVKLIMAQKKEKKKKKKEDRSVKKAKKAASAGSESREDAGERSLYEWNKDKKKKNGRPEIVEKIPVRVRDITLGEGLTKVCVPIVGSTENDILLQAEYIRQAVPDLAEWRADMYADILDTEKAGALLEKLSGILGEIPILFTLRSRREGGNLDIEGAEYENIVLWAARRPEIDLIDIEGLHPDTDAELLIRDIHGMNKPVIASCHFYDRTPKRQEMEKILDKLERTGGDILKLAVMPEKAKDVLKLMEVTAERNETMVCPLITMSMGDIGRISRISGRLTGSCMTFATVGQSSAPGQIPLSEVRSILNLI